MRASGLVSLLVVSSICSCTIAFVAPRGGAFFRLSSTAVYSDGANPPPFADWGQQPSAPPPASVVPEPAAAVASPWSPPPAPAAPAPAVTSSSSSSGVGGSSMSAAANAIATLEASQTQTVDSIAAAIPDLARKPDYCWNSETIAGNLATLEALDAPGPANIAWLASVTIASKLSSLTIFNGPLTDVPHLLSRAVITDDETSLQWTLDFRPRAYGAYELVNKEDGTYPGPETLGRKAFEYSGNRKDYQDKFLTRDVQAFLENTLTSLEGAVVDAADTPTTCQEELLTRGPYCMTVTMPLTERNVAAIATARTQAAQYWLQWVQDPTTHAHKPGAPVNTQYVYDSKYKINAYTALLSTYTKLFGATDGAKLAAAESGPLDEAYVGGGS